MAINDNCTSKQTFCDTSGQSISSYSNLAFNYSPTNLKDQNITNEIWNNIIDAIVKIYNYGDRGTRNPSNILNIQKFTNSVAPANADRESNSGHKVSTTERDKKHKNDGEEIPFTEYNEILSTLGLTPLDRLGNLIITEEKFNAIKTAINGLSFNNTRCNDCNVSCNATCQASSQCDCDCHCDCDCDCDCYTSCCQSEFYNPWTGSYTCHGQI